MVLRQICPPALIYLIFSITQVSIDTVQGAYNTALVKIWVAFVFTVLLNYLCLNGLNVVSWLIVFIPFILMTVIVSMLLVMFGLDPSTGKLAIAYDKNKPPPKPDAADGDGSSSQENMEDTTAEMANMHTQVTGSEMRGKNNNLLLPRVISSSNRVASSKPKAMLADGAKFCG